MKKITIKDIARISNVSPTTVSLILNGKSAEFGISEETRQRVLAVCKELDYTPNVHASRLSRLQAQTIAFIAPPVNKGRVQHLFGELVMGIQEAASSGKYGLVLEIASEEFIRERRYAKLFRGGGVDGAIVWGLEEGHSVYQDLLSIGLPVVAIGHEPSYPISYVKSDDRKGAAMAVRTLLTNGYNLTAHIAGPPEAGVARERCQGYRDEITRLGGEMPEQFVQFGDFTEDSGYRCMSELLNLDTRPNGVFAGNDYMAYGAMLAITDAGLRVPQDIGIIGADNSELARLVKPGLTSVELPYYKLGKLGVKRLLQRIQQGRKSITCDVLPVNLVVRESSGPSNHQTTDIEAQGNPSETA